MTTIITTMTLKVFLANCDPFSGAICDSAEQAIYSMSYSLFDFVGEMM